MEAGQRQRPDSGDQELDPQREQEAFSSGEELQPPHVVSALIGLLTWWLDAPRDYSLEELDELFRRLVGPALTSV